MVTSLDVLKTLENAAKSLESLNNMPALADWERETRSKAIRENAIKTFNEWARERAARKSEPPADQG